MNNIQNPNEEIKKLKVEIEALKKENKMLNYIVANGDIATVKKIITDFRPVMKATMTKLTNELMRYHGSAEERQCLLEFTKYLESNVEELNKFL